MNRKTKGNQTLLTIVFIVVSLALVGGSYFVYRSRQQNMLAEQASTFTSVSVDRDQTKPDTDPVYNPEDMVAEFTDNRAETTALHYLYYVQSVDQTPTITIARNHSAQEAWSESIQERLSEVELEDSAVNSIDWSGMTSAEAVELYDESLTEADPQLVVIPTFVEEDFNAEISEEDHMANLQELYDTIRVDLPSALIVFANYPATSQDLAENEDLTTYNESSLNAIQEANYNVYDVNAAYLSSLESSEDVTLENSFTDEGFSEAANQLMADAFIGQIEETQIDATRGYDGDNQDASDLIAEIEAEEAEAAEAESLAAEEQASLDAEAESIAAEEQAALEAEEAAIAESIAAEEAAAAEAEAAAIAESESIEAEQSYLDDYYYSEAPSYYEDPANSETSVDDSSDSATEYGEGEANGSIIEEDSTEAE